MGNREHYVIVLQNEKTGSYSKLGYALVIMNVITFILFLVLKDAFYTGLAGIAATIVYFLLKRIQVKKHPAVSMLDETIFFLLAAVWLWQSIIMGILVLITGILFKIALQKFRFIFTDDGVYKDFYPKKKYEWNVFQSVILKAGILTLDFKSNKLLQALIEKSDTINEAEFNDFADKKLSGKEVHFP